MKLLIVIITLLFIMSCYNPIVDNKDQNITPIDTIPTGIKDTTLNKMVFIFEGCINPMLMFPNTKVGVYPSCYKVSGPNFSAGFGIGTWDLHLYKKNFLIMSFYNYPFSNFPGYLFLSINGSTLYRDEHLKEQTSKIYITKYINVNEYIDTDSTTIDTIWAYVDIIDSKIKIKNL